MTEMIVRLPQEQKDQLVILAKVKKQTQAEVVREAIAQAVRKARIG